MDNADYKDKGNYPNRLLARIVVEAKSPLAVGSGSSDVFTDALVATDVNGLPYIPATAIAGVLRHMIMAEDKNFPVDQVFGYQKENSGHGSEIIFTEARILDGKGKVIDGLDASAIYTDKLLSEYLDLPIRQHVKISHKGVATDSGKFDEQVVFAGTRFCFEIEMVAERDDLETMYKVLDKLLACQFRIGGGTRKGFGELEIKDIKVISLDLKKEEDLEIYLEKASVIGSDFWDKNKYRLLKISTEKGALPESFQRIVLSLKPEDFFLFGSGFGDDDVDAVPVKAKKVEWSGVRGSVSGKLTSNYVLIPATSVKGALAHRVAFHWNLKNKLFADDLSENEIISATDQNEAVVALFGSVNGKEKAAACGNVFVSDVSKKVNATDKVFNHVAIDRFTGGSLNGALFSEKATYTPGETYELEILIDKKGLEKAVGSDKRKLVNEALMCAINDLCTGMLPLGGRVNKGYGVFKGNITSIENDDNEKRNKEM